MDAPTLRFPVRKALSANGYNRGKRKADKRCRLLSREVILKMHICQTADIPDERMFFDGSTSPNRREKSDDPTLHTSCHIARETKPITQRSNLYICTHTRRNFDVQCIWYYVCHTSRPDRCSLSFHRQRNYGSGWISWQKESPAVSP